MWFLYKWRGCRSDLPTPNVLELFVHLVTFVFIEDVVFYAMHRSFHSSKTFGRFHEKHHEYRYSFALVGTYSNPVDFICKHVVVPTMGPLLLGSHTVRYGDCIQRFPSFRCAWNFGVMGFMDFAFNTDCVQFRGHPKKNKIR
uniref:Fatty acid hydroxylase domain-containing protein n=1 Tax=Romanomermis culicivorax TaxID=13658 RepID=A0A915HHC0_ROMCU